MEYAYLATIASVIGGGVIGALVRTWSIHAKLYSLEDRVGVLEGVTTREVKIRAAQSRAPKSHNDEALMAQLQSAGSAPMGRKRNWWETLGAGTK